MLDNTPTILVVDDTKTNINILVELLGDDYDVLVALDGQSAIDITHDEEIDLILLDIMMPEMDGYEACQKLKLNEKTKDIPIIFITAKTDEESIERAYDTGGRDYVTKPFKPKELLARVKTQLELKSLIDHFSYLASHEPMTGLYNRRKFFELSEKSFETSDTVYAVMLDIDLFKAINDQFGHPIGDKVIKAVAKAISRFLIKDEILGRLGGEEFAIVCVNKDLNTVQQNLEKVRIAIEDIEVLTDDNKIVKVTISSGIAQKGPEVTTLDHLLKAADDALYEAKNCGRNKVVFRV